MKWSVGFLPKFIVHQTDDDIDNLRFKMRDSGIIDVPSDRTLFAVDNLVGYTRIVWV